MPLHIGFSSIQGEPNVPCDIEGKGKGEWEEAHRERKREKRDSPITVSDYELYMSCSFNTVCSLPRFVTIKYSHQHLCRPLLITHHNNKRSQLEIANANSH